MTYDSLYSLFLQNSALAPTPFVGPSAPLLWQKLSQALYTWIATPSNISLTGVASGTFGAGAVQGTITLLPNTSLVFAGLSAGPIGPNATSLATILSTTLSQALTGISYQGLSPTVGVGVDTAVASLVNTATLTLALASVFGLMPIHVGVSQGISNLLYTMTGSGTVSGPSSTTPSTGASLSTLVV